MVLSDTTVVHSLNQESNIGTTQLTQVQTTTSDFTSFYMHSVCVCVCVSVCLELYEILSHVEIGEAINTIKIQNYSITTKKLLCYPTIVPPSTNPNPWH